MVKTNQYQNPQRRSIIAELKNKKRFRESGLWVQVADLLDKTRKNRRAVNLHKINKHTSDGDTVVVPGKVLGEGLLEHG
ncbi:MAG: 50S ribosomal protein L18e, partial [Candidatus Altiarchaeales archaeon]|nr:50S ribosomal protein L18e [Candidatus Altiarchaeales archaeon]